MNDRQRELMATAVGAALGGFAGYMLFTPRGRELRQRIEPALEDLARELVQLRGTVNRALGVASQGWDVLNEAFGDFGEHGDASAFPTHRQTNPF